MSRLTRKLIDPSYLAFPFRVDEDGPVTVRRELHVKHQVEAVLFTDQLERVFNVEFGAGVRSLVFEPNSSQLRALTRQRLVASLSDALQGEVDPKTLEIDVTAEDEKLRITISYRLATVDRPERLEFVFGEDTLG